MKILITGGAGFIGANCTVHYANCGNDVVFMDNLSRRGAEKNLLWIREKCEATFVQGDIRYKKEMEEIVRNQGPFELILHLAAQVAVTTSVADPQTDFETNTIGTFNLLEAVRCFNPEATLIYTSTNKVYGGMEDVEITEQDGRYSYKDFESGIDETRSLDFHSPYGCSKGSADQYCRDYNRIYDLNTIVFRQSCIYGYRQFGIEDQGWVAWFCIAAALDKMITVYGNGKQVRDILFIDDLIRAFELAYKFRYAASGRIYNIGGGPKNTMSILELLDKLEHLSGKKIKRTHEDWRPGDQKVFIGDISLAEKELGWRPQIETDEGINKLFGWVRNNEELFI